MSLWQGHRNKELIMFKWLERRRAQKQMDALMNQYLANKLGITAPPPPSKSDEVAAQMQDAWRFMVSNHPTIPTIDNGKKD